MVEDTLKFVEVLLKSQEMWPDELPAVLPGPGNLDGVSTGPVVKPDERLTTAYGGRSRAASEKKKSQQTPGGSGPTLCEQLQLLVPGCPQ